MQGIPACAMHGASCKVLLCVPGAFQHCDQVRSTVLEPCLVTMLNYGGMTASARSPVRPSVISLTTECLELGLQVAAADAYA